MSPSNMCYRVSELVTQTETKMKFDREAVAIYPIQDLVKFTKKDTMSALILTSLEHNIAVNTIPQKPTI